MVVLVGYHHVLRFAAVEHQPVSQHSNPNLLNTQLKPLQGMLVVGSVPHVEVIIGLPIISVAMVPNTVMSGYESMQRLYVHKEQQRAKHRPPVALLC